jgi:DNA ligase-1
MKPMLSATLKEPEALRFPILVSPKLDGIRCLIVGRIPVSRNLKKIPNQHIYDTLRKLSLPELDGELIVGSPTAEDCYRVTNSGVMSKDGEPDWCYHVFDIFEDGPFDRRIKTARNIVQRLGHKRIRIVPHEQVNNVERLLAYEQARLKDGYEGVMGRAPFGVYKQGRATMNEGSLWKLKRFSDSEAEIIGFQERMHNANEAKKDLLGRTERSSHKENKVPMGTLGALLVRDINTGVEFDIGTGFTDADRNLIWKARSAWMGMVVKYKSLPVGVKDKPRFPVYLGLRKDL